jgi:hypothetical protein
MSNCAKPSEEPIYMIRTVGLLSSGPEMKGTKGITSKPICDTAKDTWRVSGKPCKGSAVEVP